MASTVNELYYVMLYITKYENKAGRLQLASIPKPFVTKLGAR